MVSTYELCQHLWNILEWTRTLNPLQNVTNIPPLERTWISQPGGLHAVIHSWRTSRSHIFQADFTKSHIPGGLHTVPLWITLSVRPSVGQHLWNNHYKRRHSKQYSFRKILLKICRIEDDFQTFILKLQWIWY